ncbi:MAG: GGDEF domain-containing response regulator [Candidatus Anammoxibacter sp.]
MRVLIVDDSVDSILLIQNFLQKGGCTDLVTAKSATEAFTYFGMDSSNIETQSADIILMDIVMPGIDGIEAVKRIKAVDVLKEIPVIMVTAQNDDKNLRLAFEAGAIDYITKPIKRVELLARVRSILNLKQETDRRKKLMMELQEANKKLERLSYLDGLTGISNRRLFDMFLDEEWRRCKRDEKCLSLIMTDIDFFKKYNDTYGHQKGDDCLKQVAAALNAVARRPGDLTARYGGEEFVLVLSNTDSSNALILAERYRDAVVSLEIPHGSSEVSDYVTLSLGVATVDSTGGLSAANLIEAADKALYKAKCAGRNRVSTNDCFTNETLLRTRKSFESEDMQVV